MKHLFNTYLKVIQRHETIGFPEGMSHYIPINKAEDLYLPYSAYEHLINFREEKAFIIFMPLERMEIKVVIFNLIEKEYGFTMEDLQRKTNVQEYVFLRYMFFYFMKKNTKLSLGSIGSIVGKDHGTVIRGVKEIKIILDTDKGWRNEWANNLINKFDYEEKIVSDAKNEEATVILNNFKDEKFKTKQ